MSDIRENVPDTTERHNEATFDDWTFATDLPDGDVLQRMCSDAAALAVRELVNDIWLMFHFSDQRDAPGPKRFELCVHAWDGDVTLGRSFAEAIAEWVDHNSDRDGEIDDDDEDMIETASALEAAAALIRARMRPRGATP